LELAIICNRQKNTNLQGDLKPPIAGQPKTLIFRRCEPSGQLGPENTLTSRQALAGYWKTIRVSTSVQSALNPKP
jgi:hypothetical protein